MKDRSYKEEGHVMVGLLIMVLFISALVLLNAPDISVTNQVAYAYGSGGGSVAAPVTVSSLTGGSVLGSSLVTLAAKIVAGVVRLAAKPDVDRSVLASLISQTIVLIKQIIVVLSV